MDSQGAKPKPDPCFWHYDHERVRRATAAMDGLKNAVGAVNPRPPGWRNSLIQLVKKRVARMMTWYTRPLREFNASVCRSLEEVVRALEHLSMNMLALDHLSLNMAALEGRLAQSEERSASLAGAMQDQLDLLQEQVRVLAGFQKIAIPEAPAARLETYGGGRASESPRFYIDTGVGNSRTAYVIGLFGSGRHYINELLMRNIGERAKYFRDGIRLHPGPTPMIYSGHGTMKHVSRLQATPAVMSRIFESVRLGFADVIFVSRHPVDSLLTNYFWWRTYIRENRWIPGISQIYKNTDDLCLDLEREFLNFKAFADGDPKFFEGLRGLPFLSFPEFVEETELHIQSGSLTLRLEDFMIDPRKEFAKIVERMSVALDVSGLCVARPRTNPYGYLAVRDKVPQFRNYLEGLDAETKNRIERVGYDMGP